MLGNEVADVGNLKYEPSDDYPDFIISCAEKVIQNYGSMGLVIGRSGNGEAIAANKVKGIRAALCLNEDMAKKAREDNDANVLALGADFVDKTKAERIAAVFFDTPFPETDRHVRRLEKILDYESSHS